MSKAMKSILHRKLFAIFTLVLGFIAGYIVYYLVGDNALELATLLTVIAVAMFVICYNIASKNQR